MIKIEPRISVGIFLQLKLVVPLHSEALVRVLVVAARLLVALTPGLVSFNTNIPDFRFPEKIYCIEIDMH
jgi:hypothetical protein